MVVSLGMSVVGLALIGVIGIRFLTPLAIPGWATYVIAFAFVGICIGPVLYIILGGFRTNSQITASPSGFPSPWVAMNYLEVLASGSFWQTMGNSAVVGVATVLALGGSVVAKGPSGERVIPAYEQIGEAELELAEVDLLVRVQVAGAGRGRPALEGQLDGDQRHAKQPTGGVTAT